MNRLSLSFLAILFISTLSLSSKSENSLGSNLSEYSLPLKNCLLKFYSPPGGYTKTSTGDDRSGRYSHHGFFGSPSSYLAISFFCIPKPAKEECAKQMEDFRSIGNEKLQGEEVKSYKEFNSELKSEAYFDFVTAAIPAPGISNAYYCLGDSTRTLMGQSELGSGRRMKEFQAVLNILKTVRFVDDAALKAPPSPR